jgi:PAS domain S-box-containing protein
MLGYSEGELPGLNFIDITYDDERDANRALFTELLQGRRQHFQTDIRYRRKDGSLMWARVHVSVIRNSEGTPHLVVAVIDDITERKRSEEELRESERRFRILLESIPHHVWSFRTDGAVWYWNQRLIDYTGLTPEQLKQGGWAALHPDDWERVREAWQEAWSHSVPYEMEQRIRGRDGHYRRFVCRGVPVPNERGEVTEWLGTNTDVEDRRQSQEALQNVQAQLAHLTRLTTLGELSASIAHEVNQPLGAIVTEGHACLRWLNRAEPNLQEVRAAVTRIVQAGMRASDVIGRIRSLVKKGPTQMAALDMNGAITGVLSLTKHEIDKNEIILKTELAPDLRPAQGDLVQLQQVMANLIMNAIESMSTRRFGPRELLVRSQNYGKDQLLIHVRDTGIGIDPSRIDHVFQPFVTSKPEGMGMGLSISRSIIEAHGGQLWAESNEDAGITFRFSLRAQSAVG